MLLSISVALIHKGGEAKWIHTQRECRQVPGTDRKDGWVRILEKRGVMG